MTRGAQQVRELKAEIRHWRRGRADARLVDVLEDAYVAVFTGLMVTSMLVSVVVHLAEMSDSLCRAGGCREARTALPWLTVLAVVVVVFALARLFGPVFVSPATATWLLAAPVDRAALLRPRLLATAVLGAALGIAVTATGAGLGGFGTAPTVLLALTTGALTLGLVAFAALSQRSDGRGARAVSVAVAGLLWLALLALAAGLLPTVDPPDTTAAPWWVALVLVTVAAGATLVRAGRRLPDLHRRQVSPGGTLLPGLSGALSTLDLALAFDVLLAHRWNGHAAVRSRRGGPSGPAAVVWSDLTRLRRSPGPLLVVAAGVAVPYAAVTAGAGRVVVLVAALVGFLTALPLLSALRVVTRTPDLARMLPFPTATTRSTTLLIPGAVTLAFGLSVSTAIHRGADVRWSDAVVLGVAVAASALASACRWMTGRPPDYSRPLVSTPAGGVPTNLYGSALRGFDILLLTTLPMLISPTASGASFALGFAGLVVAYLVGRP